MSIRSHLTQLEAAGLVRLAQTLPELGNLPMQADNLAGSADLLLISGNVDQALEYALKAHQISTVTGNLWGQSYSLLQAGQAYLERGEIAAGIEALARSFHLGGQAGFAVVRITAPAILGTFLANMGAAGPGLELVRQAHGLAQEILPGYPAFPLAALAEAHLLAGNDHQAEMLLQQARQQADPSDFQAQGFVGRVEIRFHLARGNYEAILQEMAPWEVILEQLGLRLYLAEFIYLKGQALRGAGRLDEARSALAEALVQARNCGSRRLLWFTLEELVQLEEQVDNVAATRDFRRQLREVIAFTAGHTPTTLPPELVARHDSLAGLNLQDSFLSLPAVRKALDQG
ncbi:MAG: hypothetical protein L0332_08475 [Chloroflexi bacterium]|nr:hypothetical protein [Chloroflexota bacterium]MCI0576364.1 hypothetical protein [Chloroflexota bacterium]MCI0646197.1 hypothetical protein [Chloroflexota bacterium]MCI0726741.1 hypothetical protein [Chloroflexota bacterium]